MAQTIAITLKTPARFLDVQPKTDEDGTQLHAEGGRPLWRFRCLIDMDTRWVNCPATVEEVKGLKSFAPVHFHGLVVGAYKESLWLKASGIDHNPEGLPLTPPRPVRPASQG